MIESYENKPPDWRLPYSATNSQIPDFTQPSINAEEDDLSEHNVKNGYISQPLVQNETFSCHQLIISQLIDDSSLVNRINETFNNVLNDRHLKGFPTSSNHSQLQQSSNTDSELYFKNLALIEVPLQSLLDLPINLSKDFILNQLNLYKVPMLRSIWFIKIITNFKIKPLNPSVDWTTILTCKLSKCLLDLPMPTNSMTSNSTNNLISFFDHQKWLYDFNYYLEILRYFIKEDLVHYFTLHVWLLDILKSTQISILPIVATLVEENLNTFFHSIKLTNTLLGITCSRLNELRLAFAADQLTNLINTLHNIIIVGIKYYILTLSNILVNP